MSPPSASSQSPAASASAPGSDLASLKKEPTATPDLDMSEDEYEDDLAEPDANSSGKPTEDGVKIPIQKRRRVTRACDECRRKKIKCNGRQPCTHCQVYSYDCTYDKPSNRRRNPAPQYIEALESKLTRAETLLRQFMPDVDLNDPGLDPSVQQEFRLREQARVSALKKQQSSPNVRKEAQLRSMIDSVGQLELGDKGEYDFHGNTSGPVFFRRMKDHFRSLLGKDNALPNLPKSPRPAGATVSPSASPGSVSVASVGVSTPGSQHSLPNTYDLPPKEKARALCVESLQNATCLLRIVHIPTFYETLDKLYEKPIEAFDVEENRGLALVYSVMALGCMYNVPDRNTAGQLPYKAAHEEGFKYYSCARSLLPDVTECRDLMSLQALLFMILFVQSISNLSTCYGYVGVALRSALRMGLHRDIPHSQINAIESETRRRVFYVCRQMDTYVSVLLGFPLLLNDDDIDQPLPTQVDDNYITSTGILTPPPNTPSFFEAFNAHVKLMRLLSKIIKHVYPLKGSEAKPGGTGKEEPNAKYMISHAQVKELEEELAEWQSNLPFAWRPNPEGPPEVVRVRNLLRFAFAHVQMVLYRPFLHYASSKMPGEKNEGRGWEFGASGITVARNIVHIGLEMRKQVSLVGPYWFTLFTEYFAIITLLFYVLENQKKEGIADILDDAVAGKNMISSLARTSLAADRITQALGGLFDQLPLTLRKVKAQSLASKKRPASGSHGSLVSASSASASIQAPRSSKSSSRSQISHISQPGHQPSIRAGSVASMKSGKSNTPSMPSFAYDNTSLAPSDFNSTLASGYSFSPFGYSTPSQESVTTAQFQDGSSMFQNPMTSGGTPVHQLDALMFPSGDPLAYPTQPPPNFSSDNQSVSSGGMLQQDTSQFFMPDLFDGIEGQLMGPLPPYLMQSQAQSGLDFSAVMHSDPMMGLQSIPEAQPNVQPQYRPQQQQQQQQRRHASHQPAPQHQQSARRRPHVSRDPENLLVNTPWHGMFPQHGMD